MKQIVIVGAGVSGLVAAINCEAAGFSPILIDADKKIGGRTQSNEYENFILDKGFQVLLTEYESVKKYLDLKSLHLKYFSPGAFVFSKKKDYEISDPFKEWWKLSEMIFSGIGTVKDKWLIFRLSQHLKNKKEATIFNGSKQTTLQYLREYGFSERIIDLFSLIFMFLVCLLLQFQEMFGFVNTQVFIPLKNNLLWVVLSLAIGIFLLWIWKKYQVKKPKNEASFLQKLLNGMNSIFLIKNPIKFIFLSLLIWFCYWFSLYFQLESLEITQHLTPGNALGILIFSAIGIIIPVPGGAGAWGPIAYGMTFIYHLNQNNAESFGIFTIAFSILLQVVIGGVCYGLLFYEMQKNDENQPAES